MIGFEIIGLESLLEARQRVEGMHRRAAQSPQIIAETVGKTVLEGLKDEIPVSDESMNSDERNSKGHARDLLDYDVEGATDEEAVVVFSGPSYVQYIIEGSDAHLIPGGEPRQSGDPLLRFQTIDGEMFAGQVDHPSVEPNDFRERAWANIKDEVQQDMLNVGYNILHGAASEDLMEDLSQ